MTHSLLQGSFLIGSALVVLALVIRYVYWTLDRELQDLARAENDAEYRAELLARLDARLVQRPAPKLWLQRANLRRFAEDLPGVREDLQAYLAARPRDDAGWSELAEACSQLADHPAALAAAERAWRLDPKYADYPVLVVRCALLAESVEIGREALRAWEAGRGADWEIRLYRAALFLEAGESEAAAAQLAAARREEPRLTRAELANEPALRRLADWSIAETSA